MHIDVSMAQLYMLNIFKYVRNIRYITDIIITTSISNP